MKSFSCFIPEWLSDVGFVDGHLIVDIRRVEGGVVSDVWSIQYKNGGKYVIRRTAMKDGRLIIKNLNMAVKYNCLPEKFRAMVQKDYIISYYQWVIGDAMQTFNKNIQEILEGLTEFRSFGGFMGVKSIYEDVFKEAAYVKKYIHQCSFFSEEESRNIEHVCNNVLSKLSKQQLFMLLDCRGRMTHGDPKPANVICHKNKIQFIDWDKICSLSPESDVIYSIFTGNIDWNIKLKDIVRILDHDTGLYIDNIKLAICFLPSIYLIHDIFICLSTGTRYGYVRDEVLPLWYTWENVREYLQI